MLARLFTEAKCLVDHKYTSFSLFTCLVFLLGSDAPGAVTFDFGIWVVKTRRSFPCVKVASSRAAVALEPSHRPPFGQLCKARPWESLACAQICSARLCNGPGPASSFIPATTARAGKARLTVPRCLQSFCLISLRSRPPTLSGFSIFDAIRRGSRSFVVYPWIDRKRAKE